MQPWYNVRKAAEIAAFFANAQGGSINVLKLTKLVYLAEREFLNRYDASILNDALVSMDHGPVNSITYDCIKGSEPEPGRNKWNALITDRARHEIGATRSLNDEDYEELNDAELQVFHYIWNRFGHMNQYQLRDYTHEHCPEWEDPQGSSNPIPYSRVAKFLAKDNSQNIERQVTDDRAIERFFRAIDDL